jgi:hypothetical protein
MVRFKFWPSLLSGKEPRYPLDSNLGPETGCPNGRTGSPRFTRTRHTLFRLYAILLQKSVFTQVAVLQGGVCKMGDRSFICVSTLKVIAVSHTCIHTKTVEFHWKKASIYAISVYVTILGTHLSRKTRTSCILWFSILPLPSTSYPTN